MSTPAKIAISKEEAACLKETQFFQHKRNITEKVYNAYARLVEALQKVPEHRQFSFPKGADTTTGNISRGENYRGLPYIVLDFPRLLKQDTLFLFRTTLWWGHFYSFTLHLNGRALQAYRPLLFNNTATLQQNNWYVGVNTDEWQHHLQPDNYREATAFETEALQRHLKEHPFIKLTKAFPLEELEHLEENGETVYKAALGLLA